jgi:Mn-dependent DtxR family transcriptional regulator
VADNTMLEKLNDIIISTQKLNQNKCGITIIFLANKLNIDLNEVKELLNQLHSKKLIIIRQGINQKLVFLRA